MLKCATNNDIFPGYLYWWYICIVTWSWVPGTTMTYNIVTMPTTDPYKLDMKPCFSVAGCNCPEMDVRMFCGTNQIHNWPLGKEVSECLEWEQIQLSGFKHRQGTHVHNVSMVLYNAELKIFQDQGTALTSCVLTWSLGKVIPEDLYANMTVLQILKICHFVPF
jgi:hypothetical protein